MATMKVLGWVVVLCAVSLCSGQSDSGDFAGLSMGEHRGYAPTFEVLLNDGATELDIHLLFRPTSCTEKLMDYKFWEMNENVLKASDILLTSEKLEKNGHEDDIIGGDRGPICSSVAYNLTVEFNFNTLPGYTPLTLVMETENDDGTRLKYFFVTSFTVAGVVLYEKLEGGAINVVSGTSNAYKVGDYGEISMKRTRRLSVAYQTFSWDKPSPDAIEMQVSDPLSDEWYEYFTYDRWCPAVFLDTDAEDWTPSWDKEGRKCMMGFTNDLRYWFVRFNFARMGCGMFIVTINWPALTSQDGIEFYTTLNVELDMTVLPPVVVDCVTADVDFYGATLKTFHAYNVIQCENKLYSNEIEAEIEFGSSRWNMLTTRLSAINQLLGMAVTPFAMTESHGHNVTMKGGTVNYRQQNGDIVQVPMVVHCSATDDDGDVMAHYNEATLAISIPPVSDSDIDEDTVGVEVQVQVGEITKDEFTRYRNGKFLNFFNQKFSLRDSKTEFVSNRMLQCSGPMCTLRNLVSRQEIVTQDLEEPDTYSVYKYQIVVPKVDADGLKEALTESIPDFQAQTESLPSAKMIYVGDPTIGYADGGRNGGSGAAGAGLTPTFIAVIAAAVLGLLLLVLAIVYVIIADKDENTTNSDWSEGGVSVEGVPVPSSRYYDNVIFDDYGRGDGNVDLHVERPAAASAAGPDNS